MGKIDIEFSSKCSERTVGCIKEGICGAIIHRSEPFALEDSPESLSDIQMWTIWRQEKEKQAAFLPYRSELPHELASVDTRIVKDHTSILAYTKRKPVKEIGDFIGRHILDSGESFISVVAVYHAENVEPQSPFGRNIDILAAELPSVWHISLGADVAFISIIEVDETVSFLLFEFLQLLGLIRIELRRGFPLRTFPNAINLGRTTTKKRSWLIMRYIEISLIKKTQQP